jgi:predicted ATPase
VVSRPPGRNNFSIGDTARGTPASLDVFNPGEKAMTGPTITELDERIAMVRENINELIEQAAAYSGAADENRTADRIADQEQELAKLIELRDALLRR